MSKRKNSKSVSYRVRKEFLENVLENLDNEDEDDIFENTNLDSDSDTDTDMDQRDPTGEGDLKKQLTLIMM